MIQTQHAILADKIFYPYVIWLFKRHFYAIHVLGEIPDIPADLPLLILPNHSTWWDGFFVYFLNKKIFKRTIYLMMLEEQLSKYRFFSKIGAYSIEPKSPKGISTSLGYTVSLLRQKSIPPPLICIFPQGSLEPWKTNSLDYKRGLSWILERYTGAVSILPLAIRCEFLYEQNPEVFFLFGENYRLNFKEFLGISWLEKIEETLLKDLEGHISRGEGGQILLQGYRSVHETFDSFVHSKNR